MPMRTLVEKLRALLGMGCYDVLVHGRLVWSGMPPRSKGDIEAGRPAGFYCHRHVLAPSIHDARDAAFRRVRANLDRQTGWITAKAVTLELEAEAVAPAPIYRLMKPGPLGHIFYDQA